MVSTNRLVFYVFSASAAPRFELFSRRGRGVVMTSVALTMLYAAEPISGSGFTCPAQVSGTNALSGAFGRRCASARLVCGASLLITDPLLRQASTTQPRTRCTSIPTGQATLQARLSSSWSFKSCSSSPWSLFRLEVAGHHILPLGGLHFLCSGHGSHAYTGW